MTAWKSGLLRVLCIKWRWPLLCQKYTISSQASCNYHAGVRTTSELLLSHEHFVSAMCLHGGLVCYVSYVLSEDCRYCVKSIQFRVKLVAGYITILVINNENLLVCQIILLQGFLLLIKRWHFLKLKLNLLVKKYFTTTTPGFELHPTWFCPINISSWLCACMEVWFVTCLTYWVKIAVTASKVYNVESSLLLVT